MGAVLAVKVLVCGSRDWPHPAEIEAVLAGLYRTSDGLAEIIHGAARGADRIAADCARSLGLAVTAFPADWDRYGKRAGFLRNLQMLDQAPDLVIAFQWNGSRGTQHTIDEARRRGIDVEVYTQ